jgi:predicted GNAT family acetyltransferase
MSAVADPYGPGGEEKGSRADRWKGDRVFRDNATDHRFEWAEQGQTAFSDYARRGEAFVLSHVEAPIALRGTGAAGRLMQAIVDHARDDGLKLIPTCSYAVAWFRRHSDNTDVLA